VNLLREVTLTFSTEEEKRFILNADFTNDSDLDIIIPFFIEKLKQISLYYKNKRKDIKSSAIRYNLKGSNLGVETIVKKLIHEYVESNIGTGGTGSKIYNNFDVSVVEMYSDSDVFYDKKEDSDHTSRKSSLVSILE
jgi:hypothetical protein